MCELCRNMTRTPPDSLFPDYPTMPDDRFERHLAAHGLVAGLDEAGRGPLAGPVVAAAVILDLQALPDGLNDSKALSKKARERLFEEILATSTVSIASASAREIEATNIRAASLTAMSRALHSLPLMPSYALVDGRDIPPGFKCPARALIKGDARSLSIAAASIIAKVTRDRLMAELAGECPGYGWERNKGYGTAEHREALACLGITRHHRRSFAPVRALVGAVG